MRAIIVLLLSLSLFLCCIHAFNQKFRSFKTSKLMCSPNGPLKSSSLPRPIKVALTRERGVNNKLADLLSRHKDTVKCIEIPCIEFRELSDKEQVQSQTRAHDAVILTSPQAAGVFFNHLEDMDKSSLKVISVGKGTSEVCVAAGVSPVFEPSAATGAHLADELPNSLGESFFYPCSALAPHQIPEKLEGRGFKVTRLNTYTTQPAEWASTDHQDAKLCSIVAFASPSTVKVWNERVGNEQCAVAIGPTTQKCAVELGFLQVFTPPPEKIDLDSWANLIVQVAEQIHGRC